MFKALYRVKYEAVDKEEDARSLISDSSSLESSPDAAPRPRGLSPLLVFVIALVCSLFASLLGAWIDRSLHQNLDSICTTHTSKYSQYALLVPAYLI